MTERDDEQMRELLKQAMRPVAEQEPRRDLWPAMQVRMAARQTMPQWMDWALAAAALLFVVAFPTAIPVLLYCL
ncbi:MAG: hypothetical protein P4L40_06955 [Terracidiphilus sp.]|nr:hypothetical protein [Terracidiphilus sp.]